MKAVDKEIVENVRENMARLMSRKKCIGMIADEADCGPQYAADIVAGKLPPSLPFLLAVAKIYRVSLDDLCFGSVDVGSSKPYLTERQVEILDKLDAPGATVSGVAKDLGVSRAYIYSCIDASGERWRLRKYGKKKG